MQACLVRPAAQPTACALLLTLLVAATAACEGRPLQEPRPADPDTEGPTAAPSEAGPVLGPDGKPIATSDGRPVRVDSLPVPDLGTVTGQPGGFLTFRLPSPTRPEPGSVLPADHPLHRAFVAKAREAEQRLTHGNRRLSEVFATDAQARALWESSISTVLTAESDAAGDGTYLVVVQARLRDLILYLRR